MKTITRRRAVSDRYKCQQSLIDQQKLKDLSVLVDNEGHYSDFLLCGLLGLGVGSIYLRLPEEKTGFLREIAVNQKLSGRVALAQRVNFEIDVSDAREHATTDVTLEKYIRPAGSSENPEDQSFSQAGIYAGLKLQELFNRLNSSQDFSKPLSKSSLSLSEIFSKDSSFSRTEKYHSCAIIGAGGIGTYAAINASRSDFERIHVIDGDSVEFHNLHRQVLFYDSLNKPKAESLAQKISTNNIEVSFSNEYLTESSLKQLDKFDVLFSCVDKKSVRKVLSKYAYETGKILIDGGVNRLSGNVTSYSPDMASCLGCRTPIDSEDVDTTSCSYVPTPTIIIPHMVAASLMFEHAKDLSEKTVFFSGISNTIYSASARKYRSECYCR